MVKWGETQSLFQMSLALNLAYFAIREIRTPVLARHDFEIAKVEKECSFILALLKTYGEFQPIKNKLGYYEMTVDTARRNLDGLKAPYSDDMLQKEAFTRNFALMAAGVSFGLLVYSTFFYGNDISTRALLAAIVFCFAPPVLFVVYNLIVLSMMRGTTNDVRTIGKQIADIKRTIETEDIVAVQRLRRSGPRN